MLPCSSRRSATAVTHARSARLTDCYLLTWGELVVSCDIPAGAGLTVAVRDDAGTTVVTARATPHGYRRHDSAGRALRQPGGKLVAVLGFTR